MSYDILKSRFGAFETVLSEPLPTVTIHHLAAASDETTVPLVRTRLINYIVSADELHRALHEFRTGAEGQIGLHAALEETRLEAEGCEALGRFVMAVKTQLEAMQAMERMRRNEELIRGAVGELLERQVPQAALE
ncbi:hypothetical protein DPSP01_007571 [Paraphaeosphaeria sporulosa]